jgi:hypothetical protein
MWTNQKARFIVFIVIIATPNIWFWIAISVLGYGLKNHAQVTGPVVIFDFALVFFLAIYGLLTAFALSFYPEKFKAAIERSIAKQERRRAQRAAAN